MELCGAIEAFGVGAIIQRATAPALTKGRGALLDISADHGSEGSLRFGSGLGNYVDDSVNGVRTPDGAAGSANDFDSVNILHHRVLHFPIGSGE